MSHGPGIPKDPEHAQSSPRVLGCLAHRSDPTSEREGRLGEAVGRGGRGGGHRCRRRSREGGERGAAGRRAFPQRGRVERRSACVIAAGKQVAADGARLGLAAAGRWEGRSGAWRLSSRRSFVRRGAADARSRGGPDRGFPDAGLRTCGAR